MLSVDIEILMTCRSVCANKKQWYQCPLRLDMHRPGMKTSLNHFMQICIKAWAKLCKLHALTMQMINDNYMLETGCAV